MSEDEKAQRDGGCLPRFVRRWFVPRRDYEEMLRVLETAHWLIVRHHEAEVRQVAGCFCPVCHRPDGSEPEMDMIHKALNPKPKTSRNSCATLRQTGG